MESKEVFSTYTILKSCLIAGLLSKPQPPLDIQHTMNMLFIVCYSQREIKNVNVTKLYLGQF